MKEILKKLGQGAIFGVLMTFFLFLGGVCTFSDGFSLMAVVTEYLPVSAVCAVCYVAADVGIAKAAARQDARKAAMAAEEAAAAEKAGE